MITLRCTKRAAEAFNVTPLLESSPGTSPLGDWYVNLVPTVEGGVFLFTNEQSLLSVVCPRQGSTPDLLRAFVARVGNILSMIGIPNQRIEREIEHFHDLRIGKTASRRVLGVMNDYAYHIQRALEDATPESKLSLSDLEMYLSQIPQATLQWSSAGEFAIELLTNRSNYGAV